MQRDQGAGTPLCILSITGQRGEELLLWQMPERSQKNRRLENMFCQCLNLSNRRSTLISWLGKDLKIRGIKKKVDSYLNLKGTAKEGELETESYLSVASGTQQMYGSS